MEPETHRGGNTLFIINTQVNGKHPATQSPYNIVDSLPTAAIVVASDGGTLGGGERCMGPVIEVSTGDLGLSARLFSLGFLIHGNLRAVQPPPALTCNGLCVVTAPPEKKNTL